MTHENTNYKIMAAADWAETVTGCGNIMLHPQFMTYFGCLNRDEFTQAIEEYERRLEAYQAETDAMILMRGKGC